MWPMKILRFTVWVQVLLLVASTGLVDGVAPPHTRTTRQVIPLAQGTLSNILKSMSEGAKAVRLVVSRPLQQLRNNLRFLPGSGTPTTARPAAINRPQKNVYDLSEVHYHYDDYGNRIENPKEYLKGFKNSYSPSAQHSHTHTGDSSVLPANVLKDIELKEEYKIGQDVDTGSFSSYEFGSPSFKSAFHNSQFNSFGGFETQTTHDDDWTPVQRAKPASSLHTSAVTGSNDFFGSSSSKFGNSRPIKTYRSVKHYDSDRPSTSYSFHHFASPNADYTVDTKEKEYNSFGSPVGSSSMRVSQTQNFDRFYDYFDNKYKDHHVSESQIQSMAESVVEQKPQTAALVQKQTTTPLPVTTPATTTTTTTQRTTTSRRTTLRALPRATPKVHDRENKSNTNSDRPNYPEYFFSKGKTESKQKFIPVRNIRDEEELFKGSLAQFPLPPAKFIPQAPKFPMHTKEPLHIVVGQPVIDNAGLKAKEKFRKQLEEKKLMAFSTRKRYSTTRSPVRPENVHAPSSVAQLQMDSTTTMAAPVQFSTDGYVQNEVSPVDTERKYPKKVEATTQKMRARPTPAASSSVTNNYNRGVPRGRGSVKFGARL